MPLSIDACSAEHSVYPGPSPRTPVVRAMIAKVGAAASVSQPPVAEWTSLMSSLLALGAAGHTCVRPAPPSPNRASGSVFTTPSGVHRLLPSPVRRGLGRVLVVPVPPLVRRGLRVALRRVFPGLLASERRRIEVAPGAPHRLVAAAVDEVGAEHLVTVVEEHVVAVPLVHAEVEVEAVRDGVPGYIPTHLRLHARDVRLRRARSPRERGVAGVQMGEVRDLVSMEGAAAAGIIGPTGDPGLEEGAVDDQLSAAFKQVEQARL